MEGREDAAPAVSGMAPLGEVAVDVAELFGIARLLAVARSEPLLGAKEFFGEGMSPRQWP